MSLSKSTIMRGVKRYKKNSSLERKPGSGQKLSILTSIFNIYWI